MLFVILSDSLIIIIIGAVLITDSMAAMGLCEGIHKLGNITVEVKDSRTSVAGTDILAGRLVC